MVSILRGLPFVILGIVILAALGAGIIVFAPYSFAVLAGLWCILVAWLVGEGRKEKT